MSGVFKISEAALLALHAMAFIADHLDRMVTTKEIATCHNASEAHLSKVMQRLVKAGMVKSVRGPGGGFVLEKKASDIALLDIYELFEGKLSNDNCLFSTPVCGGIDCIFGNLISELNSITKKYLEKTKLSDTIHKK
jgi:Rrf2 family protein